MPNTFVKSTLTVFFAMLFLTGGILGAVDDYFAPFISPIQTASTYNHKSLFNTDVDDDVHAHHLHFDQRNNSGITKLPHLAAPPPRIPTSVRFAALVLASSQSGRSAAEFLALSRLAPRAPPV